MTVSQGRRGQAEEALAEFYDFTRRLLVDAQSKRDLAMVRRAKIRIDGERFSALSEGRQQDLMELYAAAMMATGMAAP